jgi:hypothetical protein
MDNNIGDIMNMDFLRNGCIVEILNEIKTVKGKYEKAEERVKKHALLPQQPVAVTIGEMEGSRSLALLDAIRNQREFAAVHSNSGSLLKIMHHK